MDSTRASSMVLPGCFAAMALLASACGGSPGAKEASGSSSQQAGAAGTSGAGGTSGAAATGSGGAAAGAGTGGNAVIAGSGGAGSGGSVGEKPCTSSKECDDGDPCTTDTCAGSNGEVAMGRCAHAPAPAGTACDDGDLCTSGDACAAGGTCVGTPNGSCLPPPVEACPAGCAMSAKVFPPATPLAPPGLPAACAGGFEMNNGPTQAFTVQATGPMGSPARTLDIELATYLAPDHIKITATAENGKEATLVDTCSLQTADYSDPTNGCTRPPDDSIRQYKVALPAGTKSLTFDVSGACTPTYLRVLGLCDFTVTPFFPGCGFRLVP